MAVTLQPIDKHNFYQVLEMERPEGGAFVAPNSISLAEAWLYRDEHTVRPRAIYDGDALVGFVMTHDDLERKVREIWRILLPDEFVNQGYGTATVRLLIEEARNDARFERVELSYVPGNAMAEHVYRKLGFVPTGNVEDGEIVMAYRLD